jgi:creatinine amidohydrolase
MMTTFLISEMTWPAFEKIAKEKNTVIIPFGTNENNGPHLPLSLDAIVAFEISLKLADACNIPVAPLIPWGNSSLFARYPGTIVIRSEVLIELIKDVCRSLGRHGFDRFIFLTPHLPNIWSLNIAAETLRNEGCLVITVDWWRLQNKLCADLTEGKSFPMGHASELATSLLLALRPDLVHLAQMQEESPKNPFYLKYSAAYPMLFMYNDMKQLSESGVVGDPGKANREKGEEIIKRCMAYLIELCQDFEQAELPIKQTT